MIDYEKASSRWNEIPFSAPQEKIKEIIDKILNSTRSCVIATASQKGVNATPVHYIWRNGNVYIFSEGGEKFSHLCENKNVSVAVYNQDGDFGNLHSVVIHGNAEILTVNDDEFIKAVEWLPYHVSIDYMKKLDADGNPMHLIKIVPKEFKVLDSELKKESYSTHQFLKNESGDDEKK